MPIIFIHQLDKLSVTCAYQSPNFLVLDDAHLGGLTYRCPAQDPRCTGNDRMYLDRATQEIIICPAVLSGDGPAGKYIRTRDSLDVQRMGVRMSVEMRRFMGASILHEWTHYFRVTHDAMEWAKAYDPLAQDMTSFSFQLYNAGVTDGLNVYGREYYGSYNAMYSQKGRWWLADSYKQFALDVWWSRKASKWFFDALQSEKCVNEEGEECCVQ